MNKTILCEQSATSTTFAGSVAEHLQADTEDASLLIRPATLSRFKRDFAAAYKSADLLTYLLTYFGPITVIIHHRDPQKPHLCVNPRLLSYKL